MIDHLALSKALQEFETGEPFAHVSVDDFLSIEALSSIAHDLPDESWPGWRHDAHAYQVGKLQCTDLGTLPAGLTELACELVSPTLAATLRELSGGREIYPDPFFCGAGLQAIRSGGFLAPHCDPEFHSVTKLRRAYTLVLFLTDADPASGGELVLYKGDNPVVTIVPKAGRCVLFRHGSTHVHGVREWRSNALRLTYCAFYYEPQETASELVHAPKWSTSTTDQTSSRPLLRAASRAAFACAGVLALCHTMLKRTAYRLAAASGNRYRA